jgi:hypothetical protein
MNIFGKTITLLFLASMLASCNSSQSTPTLSQEDKMETAISTVSTAFVGLTETQKASPTVPPQGSGLLGRYYIVRGQIPPANPFIDRNLVLTRVDKRVDFIWPYGGQESPGAAMPNDLFAVSWDGQVYAPVTGVYIFGTYHDDGARLYVDNTLLYDDWKEGETRKAQNRISLIAGTWYPIRLEFWENVWTAEVQLFWSFPGQVEKIIPSVNLKPDVSTALTETQPALATPSPLPSRAPSNTPLPSTPTKTASPVPPPTEEAALSSTPAPETLTPGPLTCQLNINQNIQVLEGTNLWSQPDVVKGSLLGTLPAGTSVYVISAPAWGRIQETGVSGWWWEISNESNGGSAGWIWEGRIEECH